jgi:hypothetical protein
MVRYLIILIFFVLFVFLFGGASAERRQAGLTELQAGFAETDITPRLKAKTVYLAGFGHNRKASGVHDPLKARALVLGHGKDKIALVSLDLIGFFHPRIESVRQRLPGFRYVLVSSTHNHEGPDTLGLWGASPFQSGVDAEYLAEVEKQIIAAVEAAEADCKPVHVRIGHTRAPELLYDAREPYVKHDELVALEFRENEGRPAGLVVQWNCHPETLGGKNTLLSADFVGVTVQTLRKKHHCPIVYFSGTVGGLMTSLHVEIKNAAGKVLDDGTFEKTERYGELLAEAVEHALKAAQPVKLTPLQVRRRLVFLPLDNKLYLLARQLGVVQREAFLWNGDLYQAEPAKEIKADKPLCLRSEIAWLRLGALDIAAIPGEIYPELVLDKVQDPADPGADFPDAPIEPALYKQLRGPHRMLIGLAGDEIGYIIPKRQWDEKAPFCYGRKTAPYGEVNSLGANTAPLLCRAFQQLVQGKE